MAEEAGEEKRRMEGGYCTPLLCLKRRTTRETSTKCETAGYLMQVRLLWTHRAGEGENFEERRLQCLTIALSCIPQTVVGDNTPPDTNKKQQKTCCSSRRHAQDEIPTLTRIWSLIILIVPGSIRSPEYTNRMSWSRTNWWSTPM